MYAIRSYYDTGYEELIKSELNNTFNGIDSIFEIKTTNQYLLFRTTPLKKDNKITQILVVIQDISNDKKLVRSQGIASAFLNSNTDSIIILNRITSYNVCYTKLLRGWPPIR